MEEDILEEILTADEASEHLKISRSHIIKMAREKRVPATKIGKDYRFTRNSLNRWINERLHLSMSY